MLRSVLFTRGENNPFTKLSETYIINLFKLNYQGGT